MPEDRVNVVDALRGQQEQPRRLIAQKAWISDAPKMTLSEIKRRLGWCACSATKVRYLRFRSTPERPARAPQAAPSVCGFPRDRRLAFVVWETVVHKAIPRLGWRVSRRAGGQHSWCCCGCSRWPRNDQQVSATMRAHMGQRYRLERLGRLLKSSSASPSLPVRSGFWWSG